MDERRLQPDTWVDSYADYLYNFAVVRVGDDELAKDLVQETFAAGLQSAANYRGKASERTWLVAILKRKVIDYYRRKNSAKGKAEVRMNLRGNDGEESDWLEEMVADPHAGGTADNLENEELRLALESCIQALPAKQGRVFRMKTIEEQSTEDICNALGINPSNLWVMIHRARQSLMSCLNKKWFQI